MKIDQPLNYPGKYESYQIVINCVECGTQIVKKSPVHKYCPECAKKVQRQQSKKWKKENPEKVKESKKKSSRKYYWNNRDKQLERKKIYYLNNREKFLKQKQDYYAKNRDYILGNSCSKNHDNCRSCPYDDCIKA